MIQNNQLPLFVEEDILQQIVSVGVCLDPCVAKLQQGLELLGMLSALSRAANVDSSPETSRTAEV